ncbi:hypothetical protein C2845_PM10G09820 [Panicum miliaceum]|uniref:Uncharacterized protein n=1 Tax=Panicum miliaceum TaxID=4540 RepID=A0A3L6PES9_PANMI|nr:hypothetical protein C2845_PM10G09820 [Panicum miliaceum]
MLEEQPQPQEAEDDDWVNGLLAQEALEFDTSPPSSPLQPISSSPRSDEAPSTSKPADVGVRTCMPWTIETYPKDPLAMVDKFLLGAMKNSSAHKASASASNVEKSSERSSDFWATDECPAENEYGKLFLHDWELLEGWWEMRKFHTWIMRAMKLGVRPITMKTQGNALVYWRDPSSLNLMTCTLYTIEKDSMYNSFPCGASYSHPASLQRGRPGQVEHRRSRPFLPPSHSPRRRLSRPPEVRAALKNGGGGVALFSLASRWARPPRSTERAAHGGDGLGGWIRRRRAWIQCPRGRIRRRARRMAPPRRGAGCFTWTRTVTCGLRLAGDGLRRGDTVSARAWATRLRGPEACVHGCGGDHGGGGGPGRRCRRPAGGVGRVGAEDVHGRGSRAQ